MEDVSSREFLLRCLRKAALDSELVSDVADACELAELTARELGSGQLTPAACADSLFLTQDEARTVLQVCRQQCLRAGVDYGDGAVYEPKEDDGWEPLEKAPTPQPQPVVRAGGDRASLDFSPVPEQAPEVQAAPASTPVQRRDSLDSLDSLDLPTGPCRAAATRAGDGTGESAAPVTLRSQLQQQQQAHSPALPEEAGAPQRGTLAAQLAVRAEEQKVVAAQRAAEIAATQRARDEAAAAKNAAKAAAQAAKQQAAQASKAAALAAAQQAAARRASALSSRQQTSLSASCGPLSLPLAAGLSRSVSSRPGSTWAAGRAPSSAPTSHAHTPTAAPASRAPSPRDSMAVKTSPSTSAPALVSPAAASRSQRMSSATGAASAAPRRPGGFSVPPVPASSSAPPTARPEAPATPPQSSSVAPPRLLPHLANGGHGALWPWGDPGQAPPSEHPIEVGSASEGSCSTQPPSTPLLAIPRPLSTNFTLVDQPQLASECSSEDGDAPPGAVESPTVRAGRPPHPPRSALGRQPTTPHSSGGTVGAPPAAPAAVANLARRTTAPPRSASVNVSSGGTFGTAAFAGRSVPRGMPADPAARVLSMRSVRVPLPPRLTGPPPELNRSDMPSYARPTAAFKAAVHTRWAEECGHDGASAAAAAMGMPIKPSSIPRPPSAEPNTSAGKHPLAYPVKSHSVVLKRSDVEETKRHVFANISSSLLRPTKAFLAWTSGKRASSYTGAMTTVAEAGAGNAAASVPPALPAAAQPRQESRSASARPQSRPRTYAAAPPTAPVLGLALKRDSTGAASGGATTPNSEHSRASVSNRSPPNTSRLPRPPMARSPATASPAVSPRIPKPPAAKAAVPAAAPPARPESPLLPAHSGPELTPTLDVLDDPTMMDLPQLPPLPDLPALSGEVWCSPPATPSILTGDSPVSPGPPGASLPGACVPVGSISPRPSGIPRPPGISIA